MESPVPHTLWLERDKLSASSQQCSQGLQQKGRAPGWRGAGEPRHWASGWSLGAPLVHTWNHLHPYPSPLTADMCRNLPGPRACEAQESLPILPGTVLRVCFLRLLRGPAVGSSSQ